MAMGLRGITHDTGTGLFVFAAADNWQRSTRSSMSALEALKLIAPTAHLERRGRVEGGAEGGDAVASQTEPTQALCWQRG